MRVVHVYSINKSDNITWSWIERFQPQKLDIANRSPYHSYHLTVQPHWVEVGGQIRIRKG